MLPKEEKKKIILFSKSYLLGERLVFGFWRLFYKIFYALILSKFSSNDPRVGSGSVLDPYPA
jgi:hypothetical protein